ncbi:MAG: hypothetical protein HXX15_21060 [Rhodopseudomonas sp.]|uniref:hypothetical protein n=1 Tax=Rhodopseudomonas sp. TaxID=1078 RepID=UPI0017E74E3B|nr:hypothetical protein [Rhodopseudomonas sp.]NVN88578.1 hypothetical protein [Rhodopseudomonas sp.]
MLETSIVCVIALALAYWMTLFLMGRREDVLHGNFIRSAQAAGPARAAAAQNGAARPALQPLPIPKAPPAELAPAAAPNAAPVLTEVAGLTSAPAAPRRATVAERVQAMSASIDPPRRAAVPPAQPEILQSLLEIIKRDLGEAVSK